MNPENLPAEIKVLIIDDDIKLCRLVKDYLGQWALKSMPPIRAQSG
jgi:hypothetical protein